MPKEEKKDEEGAKLNASNDMEECIEALLLLDKLDSGEVPWDEKRVHQLKKAQETAIVVSYTRAFSHSEHYKLTDTHVKHLSNKQREFHYHVIKNLRDKRYAHTDEPLKSGRRSGYIENSEFTALQEEWIPLTLAERQQIGEMALLNRTFWRGW